MNDFLSAIITWGNQYLANILFTLAILVAFMVVSRLLLPHVEKIVDKSKLNEEAKNKAYHTARLLVGIVTVAILLIIWGVDFSGLLVLSTSIITLTGVALFASWSLLSNITSYFILLFQNSYSKGNFIRIIDGDNYMEGYTVDINLFTTRLITKDEEEIAYPNNLVLTRPTIINPKVQWQVIGKATDKNQSEQINPPNN